MSKTRIIDCVRKLDCESTKKLLDAKPELLTIIDSSRRNLLHLAASADCRKLKLPEAAAVRMVDLLLNRGLDIESPYGRDGVTVLFCAVARGRNTTLLKRLLRRGAKAANAPGGGLFAAGWWNDVEDLDLLLRAGSPIDAVVGITPFLSCWLWKQFDAAKHLALKGANVNFQNPKNGKTALHYGVEREYDPDLLRFLVKHGASPDIQDHDEVTARQRASRKRGRKFAAVFE